MFEPINQRTDGVDGWVSLEVSPLLADDAQATIAQVADLHSRAACNIFIKIPGTEAGREAIEESIFAGIPINVTLLFSTEQYLGAAEAYMRGLERRIEAGLDPAVPSVASIFISRWDVAVADQVPAELRNRLGIAVAKLAYRGLSRAARLRALAAPRQRGRPTAAPALREHRHQGPRGLRDALRRGAGRPLHRSTRCPTRPCSPSPSTGEVGEPLPADGGDAEQVLAEFEAAGVDVAGAGGAPSARGRRGVRRVLERADAVDRSEEPQARRDGVRPRARPGLRPDPGKEPGNATRNDRTGAHGRQHGPAPDARGPRVRGLRPRFRRRASGWRARAPWARTRWRTWSRSSSPRGPCG